MKYLMLVMVMAFISTVYAKETEPKQKKLKDSCLVIKNAKKTLLISDGRIITVRVGEEKYRGAFKILNDSVIKIDTDEFLLSEIDMISKSINKKTLGLIMAQLPISFVGIIFVEFERPLLGGVVLGGAITAVVLEARRGKRYRKYMNGKKNKADKVRNWYYSIGSF